MSLCRILAEYLEAAESEAERIKHAAEALTGGIAYLRARGLTRDQLVSLMDQAMEKADGHIRAADEKRPKA